MKIVCIPVEWFTNGTLGLSISVVETVDCTRLLFSVFEAFLVSSLTLFGCIGRIRSTFNMQSKNKVMRLKQNFTLNKYRFCNNFHSHLAHGHLRRFPDEFYDGRLSIF